MNVARSLMRVQDEDFDSFVRGGSLPEKMKTAILRDIPEEILGGGPRTEGRPSQPQLRPVFSFGTIDRQHMLRAPLAVRIYVVGDVFAAENDFLDLLSYGPDPNRAFNSFLEALDVMFHEIGQAPPESLTPHASALREKFLELVEP